MNSYIVHSAIESGDGKTHRLSYDLIYQTEGSVAELADMFKVMEERCSNIKFWIQKYPDNFKASDYAEGDTFYWDRVPMKDIYGNRDKIFPPKENTDNEV